MAAPPESTVAPPGAPIVMPPGYLEQPGLYRRTRPYEDGMAVPPGYHVGSEPMRTLWISGVSLFAGVYGSTLLAGLFLVGSDPNAGALAVPIGGPIAYAALVQDTNKGPLYAGMTLVSLAQAGCATMFIVGLVVKHPVLTRNDEAGVPEVRVGAGDVSVRVRF